MHILQPPGAETPTTILVVDDAAHIRDVVKRILGGGGLRLHSLRSQRRRNLHEGYFKSTPARSTCC